MRITRLLIIVLSLYLLMGIPIRGQGRYEKNKKPDKPSFVSIDINRASMADFEKLPGIGPELARRIVAYRTKHGLFHRVEDLLVIKGIGPKKWKALRPYLRVEPHS